MIHIEWIKHFKNETLEHYALRLTEQIDTSRPYILVGLSFGGMLAAEIAKLYRPEQLILISSIPSSKQLPGYFKIAGRLKLQYLVPIALLKSASLLKRFFTAETTEEKKYLRSAIRESDSSFIRWALNAILYWKSTGVPSSYIHIHGTRDEILPIRNLSPTHIIKGGGHLMVLTRAKEINKIINDQCFPISPVNHPQHT